MKEIRPDALIISDPGVFMIAREVCPEIDIHISTQANNTNYGTYQFWHQLGARRVVTARELSMAELKEIMGESTGRSGDGDFLSMAQCAFPIPVVACYLIISLAVMPIVEHVPIHADGNMRSWKRPVRVNICRFMKMSVVLIIFNSKDLCMIEHIPELIDSGIDSFKIEGRMKTALYVATVARTYRKAIDDYLESPELYREHMDWYLDQISNCTYRQFTTGFFLRKTG